MGALLKWHTNLGAVGEEEKAEVLRTLIKKKGVVLEMEDNQVLEAAVNCWNEKNKEFSVIVVKEETGKGKWSDCDLAKEHGRLSAIEVEEEEYGDWIYRLRARYGTDHWAPWRETGEQGSNPRPHRQLVLPTRCRLAGYFDKKNGTLKSLSVKNLDNDKEQIVGKHEPYE